MPRPAHDGLHAKIAASRLEAHDIATRPSAAVRESCAR